ncbi:hypothetical protein HK097_000374, partial [Rhizophlyctis rosea]
GGRGGYQGERGGYQGGRGGYQNTPQQAWRPQNQNPGRNEEVELPIPPRPVNRNTGRDAQQEQKEVSETKSGVRVEVTKRKSSDVLYQGKGPSPTKTQYSAQQQQQQQPRPQSQVPTQQTQADAAAEITRGLKSMLHIGEDAPGSLQHSPQHYHQQPPQQLQQHMYRPPMHHQQMHHQPHHYGPPPPQPYYAHHGPPHPHGPYGHPYPPQHGPPQHGGYQAQGYQGGYPQQGGPHHPPPPPASQHQPQQQQKQEEDNANISKHIMDILRSNAGGAPSTAADTTTEREEEGGVKNELEELVGGRRESLEVRRSSGDSGGSGEGKKERELPLPVTPVGSPKANGRLSVGGSAGRSGSRPGSANEGGSPLRGGGDEKKERRTSLGVRKAVSLGDLRGRAAADRSTNGASKLKSTVTPEPTKTDVGTSKSPNTPPRLKTQTPETNITTPPRTRSRSSSKSQLASSPQSSTTSKSISKIPSPPPQNIPPHPVPTIVAETQTDIFIDTNQIPILMDEEMMEYEPDTDLPDPQPPQQPHQLRLLALMEAAKHLQERVNGLQEEVEEEDEDDSFLESEDDGMKWATDADGDVHKFPREDIGGGDAFAKAPRVIMANNVEVLEEGKEPSSWKDWTGSEASSHVGFTDGKTGGAGQSDVGGLKGLHLETAVEIKTGEEEESATKVQKVFRNWIQDGGNQPSPSSRSYLQQSDHSNHLSIEDLDSNPAISEHSTHQPPSDPAYAFMVSVEDLTPSRKVEVKTLPRWTPREDVEVLPVRDPFKERKGGDRLSVVNIFARRVGGMVGSGSEAEDVPKEAKGKGKVTEVPVEKDEEEDGDVVMEEVGGVGIMEEEVPEGLEDEYSDEFEVEDGGGVNGSAVVDVPVGEVPKDSTNGTKPHYPPQTENATQTLPQSHAQTSTDTPPSNHIPPQPNTRAYYTHHPDGRLTPRSLSAKLMAEIEVLEAVQESRVQVAELQGLWSEAREVEIAKRAVEERERHRVEAEERRRREEEGRKVREAEKERDTKEGEEREREVRDVEYDISDFEGVSEFGDGVANGVGEMSEVENLMNEEVSEHVEEVVEEVETIDEILENGVRIGDGVATVNGSSGADLAPDDVVVRIADEAVRGVVEYLDHERQNARDEEAYLNLRERTLEEQTRSEVALLRARRVSMRGREEELSREVERSLLARFTMEKAQVERARRALQERNAHQKQAMPQSKKPAKPEKAKSTRKSKSEKQKPKSPEPAQTPVEEIYQNGEESSIHESIRQSIAESIAEDISTPDLSSFHRADSAANDISSFAEYEAEPLQHQTNQPTSLPPKELFASPDADVSTSTNASLAPVLKKLREAQRKVDMTKEARRKERAEVEKKLLEEVKRKRWEVEDLERRREEDRERLRRILAESSRKKGKGGSRKEERKRKESVKEVEVEESLEEELPTKYDFEEDIESFVEGKEEEGIDDIVEDIAGSVVESVVEDLVDEAEPTNGDDISSFHADQSAPPNVSEPYSSPPGLSDNASEVDEEEEDTSTSTTHREMRRRIEELKRKVQMRKEKASLLKREKEEKKKGQHERLRRVEEGLKRELERLGRVIGKREEDLKGGGSEKVETDLESVSSFGGGDVGSVRMGEVEGARERERVDSVSSIGAGAGEESVKEDIVEEATEDSIREEIVKEAERDEEVSGKVKEENGYEYDEASFAEFSEREEKEEVGDGERGVAVVEPKEEESSREDVPGADEDSISDFVAADEEKEKGHDDVDVGGEAAEEAHIQVDKGRESPDHLPSEPETVDVAGPKAEEEFEPVAASPPEEQKVEEGIPVDQRSGVEEDTIEEHIAEELSDEESEIHVSAGVEEEQEVPVIEKKGETEEAEMKSSETSEREDVSAAVTAESTGHRSMSPDVAVEAKAASETTQEGVGGEKEKELEDVSEEIEEDIAEAIDESDIVGGVSSPGGGFLSKEADVSGEKEEEADFGYEDDAFEDLSVEEQDVADVPSVEAQESKIGIEGVSETASGLESQTEVASAVEVEATVSEHNGVGGEGVADRMLEDMVKDAIDVMVNARSRKVAASPVLVPDEEYWEEETGDIADMVIQEVEHDHNDQHGMKDERKEESASWQIEEEPLPVLQKWEVEPSLADKADRITDMLLADLLAEAVGIAQTAKQHASTPIAHVAEPATFVLEEHFEPANAPALPPRQPSPRPPSPVSTPSPVPPSQAIATYVRTILDHYLPAGDLPTGNYTKAPVIPRTKLDLIQRNLPIPNLYIDATSPFPPSNSAKRSQTLLIFSATNEALTKIFEMHWKELYDPDRHFRRKRGLPPRPLRRHEVIERCCEIVKGWSGYTEKNGENLDELLIGEVREEEIGVKGWGRFDVGVSWESVARKVGRKVDDCRVRWFGVLGEWIG